MLNNLKDSIKNIIGYFIFETRLYKLFLRNKAVVLLFHRVDDSIQDERLTCSSKLFSEVCQFAQKYFNIMSLTELVDKLNNKGDISCGLVITFDDGYLDNYEVAAPILIKNDVTACFFIATGFIGTDKSTWWDKEDNVDSKWMNWDQIRKMREWGFEIAAHTINHIDLGKIHGDQAISEIKGSKEKLESELLEPIDLFCYPYGRKDQITEENRQLVKKLGFICCPSAYGGLVTDKTDPFRIKRMSVDNSHVSKWDVGLDILRENFNKKAMK